VAAAGAGVFRCPGITTSEVGTRYATVSAVRRGAVDRDQREDSASRHRLYQARPVLRHPINAVTDRPELECRRRCRHQQGLGRRLRIEAARAQTALCRVI
jgi:hypothetical protein